MDPVSAPSCFGSEPSSFCRSLTEKTMQESKGIVAAEYRFVLVYIGLRSFVPQFPWCIYAPDIIRQIAIETQIIMTSVYRV
jgi:hypothetical protein